MKRSNPVWAMAIGMSLVDGCLSMEFLRVAIRATECFRAPLRSGPADGYRPLSPSRAENRGRIPRAVKDALRREARCPPSFRARKASLVQPGRPPALPVLDRTPPPSFGAFAPLPPKNAIRVSRKGDFQTRNPAIR